MDEIDKLLRSIKTITDMKDTLRTIAFMHEGAELDVRRIDANITEARISFIDIDKELVFISYTDSYGSSYLQNFSFDYFENELLKEVE